MKFISSLTMNASDLRQALSLWDSYGDNRNPFSDVLISPLFCQPSTLRIVRDELKEKRGSNVYFDSGGYYVQQGRIAYESLYGLLINYYRKNDWAYRYVLPDWVPTSQDSPQDVEHKVRATVTVGKMFYDEMPDKLKSRVIPVVQAHTYAQLISCMELYSEIASGLIGFGSFGTSGSTNGVNTVTNRSVDIVRDLVALAEKSGNEIHLFGVSTPPILYLFKQLKIASFDSMAWMKAAGFGNVFLPFVRGYLVTYRTADRTHTYQDTFEHLKFLTGHRCHFCDDFSNLTTNRMYRIMHNLTCVLDTVDNLNSGYFSRDQILGVIREAAPTYLHHYGVTP